MVNNVTNKKYRIQLSEANVNFFVQSEIVPYQNSITAPGYG